MFALSTTLCQHYLNRRNPMFTLNWCSSFSPSPSLSSEMSTEIQHGLALHLSPLLVLSATDLLCHPSSQRVGSDPSHTQQHLWLKEMSRVFPKKLGCTCSSLLTQKTFLHNFYFSFKCWRFVEGSGVQRNCHLPQLRDEQWNRATAAAATSATQALSWAARRSPWVTGNAVPILVNWLFSS